jgi:hypothetical protein
MQTKRVRLELTVAQSLMRVLPPLAVYGLMFSSPD